MPRNIVGEYELFEPIGSGQNGTTTVYRAVYLPTSTPCAVKSIPRAALTDSGSRADVRREVYVAQSIVHPGLVEITDCFYNRDAIFLVSDLCNGDLLSVVQDNGGGLSDGACAAIFAQMVSAIGAMHARGVAHRDIKPENILMVPTATKDINVVRICDFGLATLIPPYQLPTPPCATPQRHALVPPRTLAHAITRQLGTPSYMAPEALAASPRRPVFSSRLPPPPSEAAGQRLAPASASGPSSAAAVGSVFGSAAAVEAAAAAAAEGGAYDAFAVDVWALGVALFVLGSGWAPFDWDNPPHAELIARTRRGLESVEWPVETFGPFPSRAGTSDASSGPDGPPAWGGVRGATLGEVIVACLQVDPSLRPTVAELASFPWVARGAAAVNAAVGGSVARVPSVPLAGTSGRLLAPMRAERAPAGTGGDGVSGGLPPELMMSPVGYGDGEGADAMIAGGDYDARGPEGSQAVDAAAAAAAAAGAAAVAAGAAMAAADAAAAAEAATAAERRQQHHHQQQQNHQQPQQQQQIQQHQQHPSDGARGAPRASARGVSPTATPPPGPPPARATSGTPADPRSSGGNRAAADHSGSAAAQHAAGAAAAGRPVLQWPGSAAAAQRHGSPPGMPGARAGDPRGYPTQPAALQPQRSAPSGAQHWAPGGPSAAAPSDGWTARGADPRAAGGAYVAGGAGGSPSAARGAVAPSARGALVSEPSKHYAQPSAGARALPGPNGYSSQGPWSTVGYTAHGAGGGGGGRVYPGAVAAGRPLSPPALAGVSSSPGVLHTPSTGHMQAGGTPPSSGRPIAYGAPHGMPSSSGGYRRSPPQALGAGLNVAGGRAIGGSPAFGAYSSSPRAAAGYSAAGAPVTSAAPPAAAHGWSRAAAPAAAGWPQSGGGVYGR